MIVELHAGRLLLLIRSLSSVLGAVIAQSHVLSIGNVYLYPQSSSTELVEILTHVTVAFLGDWLAWLCVHKSITNNVARCSRTTNVVGSHMLRICASAKFHTLLSHHVAKFHSIKIERRRDTATITVWAQTWNTSSPNSWNRSLGRRTRSAGHYKS